MSASVRSWHWRFLASVAAMLLLTAVVSAAEQKARLTKTGDYNPNDATVEMFEAIASGDIAVKLIPKDSTECRVLIENKTKKPLNVKLPETFAALAQFGGGGLGRGGGGGGNRSGGNNNTTQSMGGGMGGMGGMGGGMGMFNVPPEKVGQIKATTVCLEHGKREPNAKIPYEIKPLDTFTTKPGVQELCAALGAGEIDQRAAQAAAWHLNNDMSWEELAAKQLRFANGTRRPYFSPAELQQGMRIANAYIRIAEEKLKQQQESGESLNTPNPASTPSSETEK